MSKSSFLDFLKRSAERCRTAMRVGVAGEEGEVGRLGTALLLEKNDNFLRMEQSQGTLHSEAGRTV